MTGNHVLPVALTAVQLSEIATPAALIDEARMMRNLARMQERMRVLGVRLRPHVKTGLLPADWGGDQGEIQS